MRRVDREKVDGSIQAAGPEAILNIPTTAHFLGGAVVGATPETGVVNARHEVFGYQNLLVCDGSAIAANVGVNPASRSLRWRNAQSLSSTPKLAKNCPQKSNSPSSWRRCSHDPTRSPR